MVAAKARYVAAARALYLEAYAPRRRTPDTDTLRRQAPLLGAAEALEKRAESILEWPLDERVMARVVIVTTGVFTSLVAALVLSQVGL
jgi:hypothetical protein